MIKAFIHIHSTLIINYCFFQAVFATLKRGMEAFITIYTWQPNINRQKEEARKSIVDASK